MNDFDCEWHRIEAPTIGDGSLPYVTHEGMLKFGDLEIKVVQLNTGQRVIPEESLGVFFDVLGLSPEGDV